MALFVVATLIGNMGDLTFRAVEMLKKVSYVLSEDTRETKKLLDTYQISAQQISCRDQNHEKVLPQILALLEAKNDLALVSDSGTPVISDPGFKLLSAVIEAGYEVVSVPGASSITAALSISGLPTDKFSFLGFLPKSNGQKAEILNKYGQLDSTLVIFESPFRVQKLLETIHKTLGNRYVCLCREMTKVYEECVRGNVKDLMDSQITAKGEFVVLVAKEGFSLE